MTACYRCSTAAVVGVYDADSDDTVFECAACGALQPWRGEEAPIQPNHRRLTDYQQRVLELHEQGHSAKAIAEQMGVWPTNIRQSLRTLQVRGLLTTEEQEPMTTNGVAPASLMLTAGDVTTTDWLAAARARLAEIERQLQVMEQLLAERELLRRVLTMVEGTDRRQWTVWTPEEEAELLRLVERGMKTTQIAVQLGRTLSATASKRAELLRARREPTA